MKPSILIVAFAVLGCGIYLLLATGEAEPLPAVPIAPAAQAPSSIAPAPVATSRPVRLTPRAPVAEEPVAAADVHAAEDAPPSGSALTFEEMRDHLEESFVAAPPAAARDLAQSLDKAVRAVLPAGSSVRSIECRGSLCRIETVHAGLDEFRDFVQRAFQDQTRISTGPAFVSLLEESQPGEPVTAVAYVAREGSVLPMPGAVAAAAPR